MVAFKIIKELRHETGLNMKDIHLEKLLMVVGSLLNAMVVAMAAADQMARRRSSWKTEVRSSNFHQKPP